MIFSLTGTKKLQLYSKKDLLNLHLESVLPAFVKSAWVALSRPKFAKSDLAIYGCPSDKSPAVCQLTSHDAVTLRISLLFGAGRHDRHYSLCICSLILQVIFF